MTTLAAATALVICFQAGPICVSYGDRSVWVFGYDDKTVQVASTETGPPIVKSWESVPKDFIDALGWATVSLGKERQPEILDTTRDSITISKLNLPDMYSRMSHSAQKVILIPLRIYVPRSTVRADFVAAAREEARMQAGIPGELGINVETGRDIFMRLQLLDPQAAHTNIVVSEHWFLLPKILRGEIKIVTTTYKYANFTDGTYTVTPVMCKSLPGPTRHVAGMPAMRAAARDPFLRLGINGPAGVMNIYFAAFIGEDGKLRIDGRIANIILDDEEPRASIQKLTEAYRNAVRKESSLISQLAGAQRRLNASQVASNSAFGESRTTGDPRAAFAFGAAGSILSTRAESAAKGAEALQVAIEKAQRAQVALKAMLDYLNALGGSLGMEYLLVSPDGAIIEVAVDKKHLDALLREEPSPGESKEEDNSQVPQPESAPTPKDVQKPEINKDDTPPAIVANQPPASPGPGVTKAIEAKAPVKVAVARYSPDDHSFFVALMVVIGIAALIGVFYYLTLR